MSLIPDRREYPARASARNFDMPWMQASEWQRRFHATKNAPGRREARLIFMGDSITEAWTTVGLEAWQQFFAPFQPLCLGIGGDQTQHLLWRIEQGELSDLPQAKALVLLIGVNNLGYGEWSVEETLEGLRAVQRAIRKILPVLPVLQCEILPAGQEASDPLRLKIQRANAYLRSLASDNWQILDLSGAFLQNDQTIAQEHMEDFLHPTPEGYLRFAEALRAQLDRLPAFVSAASES